MNTTKKAYRVVWSGWPHRTAIMAATTRSRATIAVWLTLQECSYNPTWKEMKMTVRAPQFDQQAAVSGRDGDAIGGHDGDDIGAVAEVQGRNATRRAEGRRRSGESRISDLRFHAVKQRLRRSGWSARSCRAHPVAAAPGSVRAGFAGVVRL